MNTVFTLARADWAPAIRATAGRVAYAVACLIVAAEMTYRAGLATGRALYAASDWLAGLASGRINRAQAARAILRWAHAVLNAPAPAHAPARPLTPVDVVTPDAPAADAPAADAPTLAETFAAVAAAAAASDARLYRAAGESIGRMRALLDEADAAETDAPDAPAPVAMACAAVAPAPAAGIAPPALESLTVAELRAMARARGVAGMGRARRADLLAVLAAPAPIPAAIAAIAAPYDANDGGQCDADAMISAIGRTLDGRDAHLWIDPAGLVWPGANVWGNAIPLLSSMREDS